MGCNFLRALLPVIIVFLFPLLFRNPYFMNVAALAGINALAVSGLSLLLGRARQVSLGHGAFMGVGAYMTAVMTVRLGLSPLPALGAALLASAILALLIGVPSLRLQGPYLALATLGFGEIAHVVMNQWVSVTGGPSGLGGIPPLSLMGLSLSGPVVNYYIVWAAVVAVLVLLRNLISSRIGRAMLCIGQDEAVSSTVGIYPFSFKLKLFVFSALPAALAGSLYAHFSSFVSPGNFNVWVSILMLMMVALGGMYAPWGPALGAVVLTVLPEVLRPIYELREIAYGVTLILVMMFCPRGAAFGIIRLLSPGLFQQKTRAMPHPHPVAIGDGDPAVPKPGGPLLELRGVKKRFNGIVAVDSLDTTIRRGQIKSIIGPNGAGKTTVLDLICGLRPLTEGSVYLKGEEISGLRPDMIAAKGVARSFQTVRLFDGLTALENVQMGFYSDTSAGYLGALLNLPGKRREETETAERAREWLRLLGLSGREGLMPAALTYWERRMLEVARALASQPELLILDEPTAGMNRGEKGLFQHLMLALKRQGITMLLVEHDMRVVMEISDEIVALNFGRAIAEGSPGYVRDHPEVIEAYLGKDPEGA